MAGLFKRYPSLARVMTWSLALVACFSVQTLADDGAPGLVSATHSEALTALDEGGVELLDERSVYSRTVANADGSRTVQVFGHPVFYSSDHGDWMPINTAVKRVDPSMSSLRQATGGTSYAFVADQNSFTVAFAEAGMVGYLAEYDDLALRMRPANGNIATASLDHDIVTYKHMWEGAHLSVQVLPDGLKKWIVLETPDAPNEYTFIVNTEGLTWTNTRDRLQFFDRLTGELIWEFHPPFAHDLADEPSFFTDMGYSVQQVGKDIEVTVAVSRQWMNDPARVFPVVIDPKVESVTIRDPGTKTRNITLDHDQVVSWQANLSAPANTIRHAASYAKIGTSPGARNLAYHEVWGTGRKSEQASPEGAFSGSAGSTYYFEVQRGYGWSPFTTHYGTARLDITYATNEVPRANPVSPSGSNWITAPRPEFSWNYTDGDGDSQASFHIQISRNTSFADNVYDKTHPLVVRSGATAKWTLPTSLADGRYYWRVRAHDGTAWGSWSGRGDFRLDTTAPPVPGNVSGSPGNKSVTIRWQSVTDAGSGTSKYEVQLRRGSSWSSVNTVAHSSGQLSQLYSGLEDNEAVSIRVRSVDVGGNASAWVQTETASHAAPTSIVAIEPGGDHRGYFANITVANATASEYRLYRDGVAISPWRPMSSRTFIDSDLSVRQSYEYSVQTRNRLQVAGAPTNFPNPVMVPNNPPQAPLLRSPGDAAHVNVSQVELVVVPGYDPDLDPVTLQLRLWQDGSPSELVFEHSSPQLNSETPEPYAVLSSVLGEGVYRWTASATDRDRDGRALDEVASPETRTFTIDTRPPDVSFDVPLSTSSPNIALNSVRISDTGSGVERIEIRNEDDPSWTAYTAWDTNIPWTLSPGDGNKTIFLRAIDRAGNITEVPSKPVRLDTTPPSVPTSLRVSAGAGAVGLTWDPSMDNISDSTRIRYDVEYRRGDGDWVQFVTDTSELTGMLTNLDDNELVHFRVRARDELGNTSEWSLPEPGASLAGMSKIVWSSSGYDPTDGHYIEFALQPVAAEQYRIELVQGPGGSPGGASSPWFTAATTGETTGVVYRDVEVRAHGDYQYRVVTENAFGVTTPSEVYEVTVANQPPSVPRLLSPGQYANSTNVTLRHSGPSLDVDDDEVTYLYTVQHSSGQSIITDSPSSALSGLVDGETYTWFVTASDSYVSVASLPGSFTVDITPPIITVTDPTGTWMPEFAVTINASDSNSGLATLEYRWNDADTWIETVSGSQVVAPHGVNTLYIRATDVAGNVSTLNRTYSVDETAPLIDTPTVESVVLPSGGPAVDGNGIFVTWNAWDDDSGISRYRYGLAPVLDSEVQYDAAEWWEDTQRPPGRTYHAIVAAPFVDGTKAVFVVEATNGVGRVSELKMSPSFTIDKSPPIIETLTLTGVHHRSGVAHATGTATVGVDVEAHDPESGISTLEYALLSQSLIDDSVTWSASFGDLSENIPAGAVRYYAVRATNGVGITATAVSSPVRFDPSPPQVRLLVSDEVTSNRETFWFSVDVEDPESGIVRLKYALGSTPGASDASVGVPGAVNGWVTVENPPSSVEQILTNLTLPSGTYYVTVEATNGAGAVASVSSAGVSVDPAAPSRPIVYDEGAFTPDDESLAAWWLLPDPVGDVEAFRYRIIGGETVVRDWVQVNPAPGHAATSVVATGFSQPLEVGVNYVFEVVAEYADGTISPAGVSNGIQVDKTPPVIVTIDDGDYSPARSVKVSWDAVDLESGITGYRYAVGSVRGATDVLDWQEAGLATHVSLDGLDLQEGIVYYVSVQATNGAGLVAEKASDGVIIDSSPPPVPFVIAEGSYTNRDDQLRAAWTFTRSDPESGTVSYAYAVASHRQANLISNWTDVGDATSVVAAGLELEQGGLYFIAVRATNGSGLTSVGFSDGVIVDTTAPDPPRVENLADYVTDATSLGAEITALDLESGISHYTYSVGTYDEVGAIVDGETLDATGGRDTVSLSGLALEDGSIYFFRVQALNEAGLLSATGMSTGVLVDTGFPSITVVRDEGDYLTTTDELHGYFESESSASNIVEYEVALTIDADDPSPDWRSNGLSRLVSFTDLSLVNGATYYVFVRAKNAAGTWTPSSEWGKSDGILVDSTPPPAPVVDSGGAFTAEGITFSWQASDPDSGLAEHRYAVGTSRGASDVTAGWHTLRSPAEVQSVQLSSLVLEHGRPYYATVQVRNNAGAWSEPGFSAAITADLTPPLTPEVTGIGAWARSQQTLARVTLVSDDPETGIVAYRYAVIPAGTVPSAFVATRDSTMATVELDIVGLELAEEGQYQVAAQFQNGVGTWSETGYSEVFTVDTLPPVVMFAEGDAELVTNDGQLVVNYTVSEAATVRMQLHKPTGALSEEEIDVDVGGTYSYHFDESDEGKYTLTARAVDPAGNFGESVVQRIRVNAKPRVSAGNDVTLRKGQPRTFRGTASDADGEVIAYEWDFGDGSEPQEGPEVEHRFIETGTYTVTLKVMDNDMGEGSATIVITVINTSAGALFLDETWQGDMYLTGDVIVPEDLSLTILPGTIVTVRPGVALIIHGSAEVGGDGDAVLLQSSEGQSVAHPAQLLQASWLWRGIEVADATGPVHLHHAIVSDADRGVAVIRSGVQISGVTFERNTIGLHVFGSSAAGTTIAEATFRENALYGIKEDGGASVMVVDSHFTTNEVGPYYDEDHTVISIEAINERPGNGGNH